MDKNLKIWMDGKIYPYDKANIHVLTHTLHYGGGVFEGIRFYDTKKGPAVFRLQDHLNRLAYSASRIGMKIPYDSKHLTAEIKRLIKTNKMREGYIRPIAYYGHEQLGVYPLNCSVHLAIAAFKWEEYLGEKPIKVLISSFERLSPKAFYADAKVCGHYVNSILAKLEATKKKYDETIMLDQRGYVAEGSGENVFIVKNGVLLTPKPGNILRGITRDSIMKIARDQKIPVKEASITTKMLFAADEAFFSGTATQVAAIKSINGRQIGKGKMGPVTKKLFSILKEAFHGENSKYAKWQTYVG
jgi:branched-chain amino acid aminotransferase